MAKIGLFYVRSVFLDIVYEILFAVKPNAVKNITVESTGHSYVALTWVYNEPKPPSLICRLHYYSQRRPAYNVQVHFILCVVYEFALC